MMDTSGNTFLKAIPFLMVSEAFNGFLIQWEKERQMKSNIHLLKVSWSNVDDMFDWMVYHICVLLTLRSIIDDSCNYYFYHSRTIY